MLHRLKMRRVPDPPPLQLASIVEAGLTPRGLVKSNQKAISPALSPSPPSPAARASFQTLAELDPADSVGSAGFESYRDLAEPARFADSERTASLVAA